MPTTLDIRGKNGTRPKAFGNTDTSYYEGKANLVFLSSTASHPSKEKSRLYYSLFLASTTRDYQKLIDKYTDGEIILVTNATMTW